MTERVFDVAILGGGPAGILAALSAAKNRDVALLIDRQPHAEDPRRLDVVPASLVALLVEFGVDPRALRVDRLHRYRWVAWESAVPRVVRGAPTAHVERPLLDRVLLSHVMRQRRITIFSSRRWTRTDGTFWGEGWRARRMIDATGRAAVTADSLTRLARPWAARTLWLACKPDAHGPPFALVPLPSGYAYRVEARRAVTIGFVGRGRAVQGDPADLEDGLRAADAGWFIDDLPPLASFHAGQASTASVQWSTSSPSNDVSRPVRIGDAALARDPLSSQGISVACSDALFAASIKDDRDVELVQCRQTAQRQAHLRALATIAARCRFSMEPPWRDYARFIASHGEDSSPSYVAALRDGNIVPSRQSALHP